MFTWKYLGLAIVFLWFMLGGITHFTNPDFFVAIMPPYIGWHLALVYISGVFEIAGAIGILIPRLRELAGNCLILLVICVTPANLHMWIEPGTFPRCAGSLSEYPAGGTGAADCLHLVVHPRPSGSGTVGPDLIRPPRRALSGLYTLSPWLSACKPICIIVPADRFQADVLPAPRVLNVFGFSRYR
ncbi:MAG: DoxX family protein [Halioglobus sp.]|nr:DoxX family protein [Halioglobus sp.]